MKVIQFALLLLCLVSGQLLADNATVSPAQARSDELAKQAAEMARLTAEIDRQRALYSRGPKRKYISASTTQPEYQAYMKAWVQKIEMVGNQNFPQEARRLGLTGRVIATVSIGRNGQLESVLINESSGSEVLDQAVKNIVELASPFPPIPTVDDVDFVEITRTWSFINNQAPASR